MRAISLWQPWATAVAVCRLTDCIPTEDLLVARDRFGVTAVERMYGNYGPGRFGWILEDVRALPEPIGFRGGQSFFTVPDDLLPPGFCPAPSTLL